MSPPLASLPASDLERSANLISGGLLTTSKRYIDKSDFLLYYIITTLNQGMEHKKEVSDRVVRSVDFN